MDANKAWDFLGWYVWCSFKQQWPYFYIRESMTRMTKYVKVPKGKFPEEVPREDLIRKIKEANNHQIIIDITLLLKKYPEIYAVYEKFKEMGVLIKYDLYISFFKYRLRYHFDETKLFEAFPIYFKEEHERIKKEIEVIQIFDKNMDLKYSYLKKAQEYLLQNLQSCGKKWSPILDKEVREAEKTMRDIVENQIWNNEKLIPIYQNIKKEKTK